MLLFLIQAVIISLTGVMAPGPITAATVGTGAKSPHAGVMVAIGHAVVEFPLMILIYYGLGSVLQIGYVRTGLFSLGGLFLIFMGADMLRSIRHVAEIENKSSQKPIAAGILLSLGNVYFLLWWATVGASLIIKAVAFGLIGVLAFTTVHWLCDLVWLYFLSAVSYKGSHVFGLRFQKIIFVVCGTALLFFGFAFLFDAARLWL